MHTIRPPANGDSLTSLSPVFTNGFPVSLLSWGIRSVLSGSGGSTHRLAPRLGGTQANISEMVFAGMRNSLCTPSVLRVEYLQMLFLHLLG